MERVGVTLLEPWVATVPMPLMVTFVALVVDQVRVEACPCWIAAGLAEMCAVGAGGGGGGGGAGAGAAFLWHPERTRAAAKTTAAERCLS